MHHLVLLAAAGLLAGGMNAVAGGGSFVTFPALVFAGLPPVIANASSTVALFPGTLASSYAYRRTLHRVGTVPLRVLLAISLAGGAAGAALLLATPARLFDAVIPWLLLLATLTFAAGDRAARLLHRHMRIPERSLLAVQFLLAVYGGYFGGAVGLMMLAAWSLMTAEADLKRMAAARVILVSATNAAAVLWFITARAVRWPEALVMLLASVLGGYAGARLAQYLPRAAIRAWVLLLTAAVTALFFARG